LSTAFGILGGTFDPVHHGHLRLAIEVLERLGLDEVRLLPTATTNLRDTPTASPAQRLAMLESALVPGLVADDREIRRGGRSYTIDTLIEMRQELPQASFYFVLGADAWNALPRWHRWQELLDYANLVIATRPGVTLTDIPELAAARCETLAEFRAARAGRVLVLPIPRLPISSTDIRARLHAGHRVDYFTPAAVVALIDREGLYRE
jgi:nicotinate-nucleotide adenylyltransferase